MNPLFRHGTLLLTLFGAAAVSADWAPVDGPWNNGPWDVPAWSGQPWTGTGWGGQWGRPYYAPAWGAPYWGNQWNAPYYAPNWGATPGYGPQNNPTWGYPPPASAPSLP